MKTLSRNFASILLSDVSRRFLGFLTLAYLTRRIGIGDFGAMNVGIAVLSYAMMISSGGLSSFGTRAVARGDDPALVGNILSMRLVGSFLAYAVVSAGAILLVSNALTVRFILLFGLSLLPGALFLDWYFQGKEQMGIIGAGRLLSALFYMVLIMTLVNSSGDLLWVPLAAFVGDSLAASLLIAAYRRRNPGATFRLDVRNWRPAVKQAFPLGAGSILAHFSINLPPIVLGILMTNREVGIYSAASKLVFFLLVLDRVLATLLLPASTRLHAVSSDRLSLMLRTALKWIVLTALPLCVGGTLLGGRILPMVFGSQYTVAAGTFCLLIWYFFFTLVHTIYTTGLVAIGKEAIYGKVMTISAVIYGASVLAGTFLAGVNGAAGAVVLSEAVTLFLMQRQFARFLSLRWPAALLAKVVLAALLMGAAVYALSSLPVFLLVFAGTCIYGALIFALRAVTMTDLADLMRRV